jgi:hypothetical protein
VIRLKPISGEQSFTVIPSSYSGADLNECIVYITDEETKTVTTHSPSGDLVWDEAIFNWEDENRTWDYDEETATEGFLFTLTADQNYMTITILSIDGLKEGSRYRIEIKNENKVLLRDTIFVTSETDKKKVYSYPSTYKKYDDGEDTYIVL